MIEYRNFPPKNGISFTATVTENEDGTIGIGKFEFVLAGKSYQMDEAIFSLAVDDTVFITPTGLKRYVKGEAPGEGDLFPNGAAYWLVNRISADKIIVLEAR